MEKINTKAITELLYIGETVPGLDLKPESMPIFLTSAYTMNSMDEVYEVYGKKENGFTYSRKRNPNRSSLEKAITYLEGGEDTLCFTSGMGGITCALLQELKAGDHVLCNAHIYGETADVLNDIFEKFHVATDYVDFADLNAVEQAMRGNTRLVFTEVLSNPTLRLTDISAIAEIAHRHDALLFVDNTFTTPLAIKPYLLGADYVVNSLTKFINGHSDASGGSLTANKERIEALLHMGMLCGSTSDPLSAWLISRGLHTMDLRVRRQMETATALVHVLEKDPRVACIYHPAAAAYAQKELAARMFPEGLYSPVFSFVVPENMELINAFMRELHFAHYAPTLGGIRTTLSHSVTSSHAHMPDAQRRKIGITPGMIRVSVGIEDIDDLSADFTQALRVFD